MRRGRTWPWIRMRPFLARFSEPVWSGHLASWADFITTTPELEFSVNTGLLRPFLARGGLRFPVAAWEISSLRRFRRASLRRQKSRSWRQVGYFASPRTLGPAIRASAALSVGPGRITVSHFRESGRSDCLSQPPSCRWRHLGADYPRWLNGETACTLRNSGSSSSEISRTLARAVDNGMPAQWVRTMM